MRKLTAIAVALLAVAVMTSPTASANTERVLTINAQGNGLVILTFPRPVTFSEGWTLTGSGRYKIALLDRSVPRRSPDTSISVLLWNNPGVSEDRGRLGVVGEGGLITMPAGTYRLYLSSDRAVTLRWPIADYTGPTRFTARPTKLQARLTSGTVPQATLPPHTTTRSHSYDQASVFTFVQARWEVQGSVGPFIDDVKICLRRRGSPDCSGDGGGVTGVDTQLATESAISQSGIWEPFDVEFRGAASADATFTGTGTHHATKSALLSISFPV